MKRTQACAVAWRCEVLSGAKLPSSVQSDSRACPVLLCKAVRLKNHNKLLSQRGGERVVRKESEGSYGHRDKVQCTCRLGGSFPCLLNFSKIEFPSVPVPSRYIQ